MTYKTRADFSPAPGGRMVVKGEYRGYRYSIGPRIPYSGIGWTIHFDTYRASADDESSSGAFYDDAPDHPEGAYKWAETAVKLRIDKIHANIAWFESEVGKREAK